MYALHFELEVEAKNKTEALRKATEMSSHYNDPAIAEFQEAIFDEPVLVIQ